MILKSCSLELPLLEIGDRHGKKEDKARMEELFPLTAFKKIIRECSANIDITQFNNFILIILNKIFFKFINYFVVLKITLDGKMV